MTRELLIARRLLEAVVNPDISRSEADDAGAEFAELSARLGLASGRPLHVQTFEGMRASDLSAAAWLYLLEGQAGEDCEIPNSILDEVFLEYSDAAIRFRLISGALGQPETRKLYDAVVESHQTMISLEVLPDCWPKRRLEDLARLAASPAVADSPDVQQGLLEFVLYLLQDGSAAALALAAAAITPKEYWRNQARDLARAVVRNVDPELTNYGRAFAQAGI